MTLLSRDQTQRIAGLARLHLSHEEADRLGAQLEAITREFSTLETYAASLPDPAPDPSAPPREDRVEPTPREQVDDILRASTRFDARERAIRARSA